MLNSGLAAEVRSRGRLSTTKSLFIFLLLSMHVALLGLAAAAAGRPNLLLLVCDDLNCDLGCYGRPNWFALRTSIDSQSEDCGSERVVPIPSVRAKLGVVHDRTAIRIRR